MRIGIDFRMLSCGRALVNRGMGRFTQQQLREVLRLGAAHEYVLLLLADHDPALLLPEIAGAPNVSRVELPHELAAPDGRAEGRPATGENVRPASAMVVLTSVDK